MLQIKSTLNKKDKELVNTVISEIPDYFRDFYLTRNNIRLSIKENLSELYKLLKLGDKILFDENGVAVIIGYAEKSPRKYIKILTKNKKVTNKFIKNLNWNLSGELFIKIKKLNPIKKILLENNWNIIGFRGKEILLKRESIEVKVKEKEYDSNSQN